ncbi:unnamed protein product [Sphagnum tenellum]
MDTDRSATAFLVIFLLFSFFILSLFSLSWCLPSKSKRNGKRTPSVLSLFNMKFTSKFWNEKVLSHVIEDWDVSDDVSKEAEMNYTKAGYLAYYLKLQEIDAIYIPIPINFIFVGFDGEGNHGVKLGQPELERWFAHIDHLAEHTRVPQMGESLTPFYHLKGDGTQRHHLPLVSYTNYNYSVHAIEMDERVTKVFERAITSLSRREDPSNTKPDSEVMWQVDMDGMSHIFSSLVQYLQLDDAYNILVLNPRRDSQRKNYGYRRGLSEEELHLIETDEDVRKRLLASQGIRVTNPLEREKFQKPLYARHPMLKFAWTTADYGDTGHWVDAFDEALTEVEKDLNGKSAVDLMIHKAQQMVVGKSAEGYSLFRGIKEGKPSVLQPDCLVDTWVGKERWAFIDLTAGPFTWGPTVGGEGVRVEGSLPSVDNSFGKLSGVTEEDAQTDLQDMVQDRFAMFEGDDQQDAVDMLMAEVDVYELFFFKHCKGRRVQLALCEEFKERMNDVKSELASYDAENQDDTHRAKASVALKRIDEWNLFSDSSEHHAQNFSIARDSFLAHLGATLSHTMKHVITPSTADGAFHYYDKVMFQIYTVTQEKLKNPALLPVDIDGLKEALSGLIVPSQKVAFGIKRLVLSEDPALAMAFSVARRSAAVPVLLVNGTYRSSNRVYLDSLILQGQLQRISGSGSIAALNAAGRMTLEVPIFWFIRSDGEPLLIDKHYMAKALPDMVFVVQSNEHKWESHLQCNSKVIYWDLNQPLKQAVAAVAEHLAGLVPTQVTYSHAHQNSAQDWMWVTGSHIGSCTAKGWEVSAFQSDTVARSYLVTTLDESILTVNAGINLLAKEGTFAQTYGVVKAHKAKLLRHYQTVITLWKRVAGLAEDLRYSEMVKLMTYLERDAQDFFLEVNETVAALHPIRCTKQHRLEIPIDLTQGVAGVTVIAVVLWMLLRRRRVKPKIN